ncbi:MAG: hypothetical protein ACJ0GX_11675 [Parasynechococcus sp.]|uniref:hypothetical protein n=1 Tax=Parasynechococcus sp. TaxID=3101203 RepID=UPI003884A5D9
MGEIGLQACCYARLARMGLVVSTSGTVRACACKFRSTGSGPSRAHQAFAAIPLEPGRSASGPVQGLLTAHLWPGGDGGRQVHAEGRHR